MGEKRKQKKKVGKKKKKVRKMEKKRMKEKERKKKKNGRKEKKERKGGNDEEKEKGKKRGIMSGIPSLPSECLAHNHRAILTIQPNYKIYRSF